jgi:glyceraldehyde-3-phosphate dehydrogenase (NAD(P))
MAKVKVAVVGYGTIGQRLADGVALQQDMELVGVVDTAPTLAVRALKERGMPYKLYCALPEKTADLENAGIPVSGTMDDLLEQIDVVLDATPAGIGAKNKETYIKHGKKAIFQAGEKNEVADVFFHGYANYEKGVGQRFLKLTSCNTTGFVRAVDCIDRIAGVEKVSVTIVRRVADPGDTHRGLIDMLMVDPIPSHQAKDLMLIMPHVRATGILVHTPVTHGHIITVVLTPKKAMTKEGVLQGFHDHPRIKVVRIADGFNSNTSLFQFARFSLKPRGDMYEIAIFEECIGFNDKDIVFALNIPQESVTIPETIDGIRACMEMQKDRLEAVGMTNQYLGLKAR